MADELFRVRSKFVAKISKSMINQLLDALLEDRLLNDGEVQSVTEDHKNKTHMARALIDTVRNKGDKASWKLIGYIQDRDPSLHEELGLGSGLVRSDPPPAPREPEVKRTVTAPPTQKVWSNKLIPVPDSVRREKMNDPNIYKVTDDSIKSRVALLITNRNFTDTRLTRKGAEIDEKNMLELLGSLHYEVVKHNDLTAKRMEEALGEFITHPKLKDTDSVFVVIMSHGKREFILGVDYTEEKPDEFPVDKIYEYLGPKKCSALLDKPKIIIIQACRGEKGGAAIVSDSIPAMNIVDDAVRYVHVEKDYISLLSSTPDTVSYRSEEFGSFMILYIFEVFNTCSHEDDLEELFRKVMRRFEDFPDAKKRVMPVRDRCSLTRRFYLFPGH